jgi:hypothetical protein
MIFTFLSALIRVYLRLILLFLRPLLLTRNPDCTLAREKIEVAGAVGLGDRVEEELAVAARISLTRARGFPSPAPRFDFAGGHRQLERYRRHVEPMAVARLRAGGSGAT